MVSSLGGTPASAKGINNKPHQFTLLTPSTGRIPSAGFVELRMSITYESAMDVEKNRSCYDTHAELFYEAVHCDGSWVGPRLLAEQVALRLHNNSDGQSTILDFGAGTGLLGPALAQHNIAATIEAADLSKDMLDVAQKTSDDIYTNFHIGLLNENFTLKNNYYDAVVSSGVIGTHVGFGCVEEIMPSVKRGGFIAFTIEGILEGGE